MYQEKFVFGDGWPELAGIDPSALAENMNRITNSIPVRMVEQTLNRFVDSRLSGGEA